MHVCVIVKKNQAILRDQILNGLRGDLQKSILAFKSARYSF